MGSITIWLFMSVQPFENMKCLRGSFAIDFSGSQIKPFEMKFVITCEACHKGLSNLPDLITWCLTEWLADVIFEVSLGGYFGLSSHGKEKSWRTGTMPEDWRKANVTPVFKKGEKEDPANYRLVSLISIPGKVVQQLILDVMSKHGGKEKRSCKSGAEVKWSTS
ncbi:rna-directed dna polymerase from mobile element hypothetical protein [Limosa lapponica baueri]|uniref:Rna-directed dna polymerase from mobile element jockey-like n=1 Tax=Limosa lapponica baueri TaxID=1758121 RepID=A0A2I0UQV6_LIMLA|nr:rna-directed dna polymerase from mobile element hypothetical protein [Limosa lapponica baueri]